MTLIKTSLLNAIAVGIKMLTLLGINKVLAIYVGPSGYAVIGQFQNAVQMITTFASGAINTGVTKYTAEYYNDEAKQRSVWGTAGTICLTGSVIMSIIIAAFSNTLAVWLLKDAGYGSVFLWFAATLVFFTFNSLLLAILNGKKEIVRYIIANISGSIFALLVTAILAINFGLYGAMVALAVYQSLSFFMTLSLCYNAPWFKLRQVFGSLDQQNARNLAKYAAMALTSAVCVPVSHILVRNYLGETLGWAAAGYWEAIWRLSAAYLMLVTTTLGIYYLPRFSEIQNFGLLKKEIVRGYVLILPACAVCGVLVYLLRDFAIELLFTPDFLPMRQLFGWQMLGDFFKVGSWMLAYLMLSKAMFKTFIALEILFSFSFVVGTYMFVNTLGLRGVAVAHALNYFVYWVALIAIFSVYSRSATMQDVQSQ